MEDRKLLRLFNKSGGVVSLLQDIRNYLKNINAWYVENFGIHVWNNPLVPDVLDVAGI